MRSSEGPTQMAPKWDPNGTQMASLKFQTIKFQTISPALEDEDAEPHDGICIWTPSHFEGDEVLGPVGRLPPREEWGKSFASGDVATREAAEAARKARRKRVRKLARETLTWGQQAALHRRENRHNPKFAPLPEKRHGRVKKY